MSSSSSNDDDDDDVVVDVCTVCGQLAPVSLPALGCCEECRQRVVQAEDEGGCWRSAYLTAHKLVQCQGASMRQLLGHLCAHAADDAIMGDVELCDGVLADNVTTEAEKIQLAVDCLTKANHVLVLLGSGASAGYNIPINLAHSQETDPLSRYAPVRLASLKAPRVGLYGDLKRLVACLQAESTCIVSTNIDGLAQREGLDELQLHGTTARLQCACCGIIWDTPGEWPPPACSRCSTPPLFNLPTDLLDDDEVVWDHIDNDLERAVTFLQRTERESLGVLCVGVGAHVHSLWPELRLIVERRCRVAAGQVEPQHHPQQKEKKQEKKEQKKQQKKEDEKEQKREKKPAKNDHRQRPTTSVVWVNLEECARVGYARPPLSLLGDAQTTVRLMADTAAAAAQQL